MYMLKQEQGNASAILKNFQRNALIKTCLLVHCNLAKWCKLIHNLEL